MNVEFNLNDFVYVKLSESGKEELKRQHEELKIAFPSLGEYNPPKEDAEGYSKWQAWDILGRLGHRLLIGFDIPFSSNVRFDKDILRDI